MKKIFMTVVLVVVAMFNANAGNYSEMFKEENSTFNIGILFGAVDTHNGTEMGQPVFGIDFTIKGIYADLGFWPQDHGGDVRVDKLDADRVWMFHVGYQVPITKWLRIVPTVGFYDHDYGYTDGHDYTVSRYGIHNKMTVLEETAGFDHGAKLLFNIKHFNIGGTVTKNAWYVSICFEY